MFVSAWYSTLLGFLSAVADHVATGKQVTCRNKLVGVKIEYEADHGPLHGMNRNQ